MFIIEIKTKTTEMNMHGFNPDRYKKLLRASFAKGVGSVLSVPYGYYMPVQPRMNRDVHNIADDWHRVGRQLVLAKQKIR